MKPQTVAWLLVLTVFIAAVAYATTGTLTINGSTSGSVVVQAPAVAGSTTFQLPGSNGTSGFVLSTDGTGVTSWVSNAGTASTALSGITAGSAVNTINSTNKAQTWNWNSLTTQTAMTFASSSLTNGAIVSIQNTAVAVTSTGKVLNISDATTGSGYGVYSSMTSHGNTGYAGYFVNTDTSGAQNYGVYGLALSVNTSGGNAAGVAGECDGSNCQGVYGNSANGAGVYGFSSNNVGIYGASGGNGVGAAGVYGSTNGTSAAGVWGQNTAHGNTGYAGYFTNTDTSASSNFGVYATVASSNGASTAVVGINTNASDGNGIEGECTASNNTCSAIVGYNSGTSGQGTGGFFFTSQSGTAYGVYGEDAGAANTGYAGYFKNTSTGGWAGYFTNTATTGTGNAVVEIFSTYADGVDEFDVVNSNGGQSTDLGVDAYGNVSFENYTYFIGFDSNISQEAYTSKNGPVYLTTDGTGGSNDNIYLEPNGSGDVQITGTLYVNASSLNSDLPLYVNSNTSDATIAISRNNDTTERNVTRYHNAAATSTTAPSYYVGEMGGDYGYGVYAYTGSTTLTALYVSTTGYVGIGSNFPSAPLTIYDVNNPTTISTEINISKTLNTLFQGSSIDFNNYWLPSSSWYNPARIIGLDQQNYGGQLAFYTKRADGTPGNPSVEALRISSTGSVGIGTTTPGVPLSLGTNSVQSVSIAAYDGGGTQMYGMGTNSGMLTFGAGISATGTPDMVITNNGNVGINTTTANAKLVVAGHIENHGTAPGTLTAGCGNTASIVGTDQAMTITAAGTGRSTTCGATFNALWNNVPICVSQVTTSSNPSYISATTTSALTVTTSATLAASAKINVICNGYE